MTAATRQRIRNDAQSGRAAQWAYCQVSSWATRTIRTALADSSHDDHPGVSGVRRGMELQLRGRAQAETDVVDCEDCGHYGPAAAGCGCV